MDLEARSLQPSVKAMLLAKLKEYKSDLNKLKREFKRISSANAHQELLESGTADAQTVMVYVTCFTWCFFFFLVKEFTITLLV